MSTGVGTSNNAVDLSPDGSTLYLADDGDQQVDVLNTGTGNIVATIPYSPDQWPMTMAESPDGKILYLGIWADNEIEVVDTATSVVSDVFTTAGAYTDALAVSPDGGVLYVADSQADVVYALNAQTGAKLATVLVGQQPYASPEALALSPDGGTLTSRRVAVRSM